MIKLAARSAKDLEKFHMKLFCPLPRVMLLYFCKLIDESVDN